MAYALFVGLVLFGLVVSPSAAVGKAVLLAALLAASITSVTMSLSAAVLVGGVGLRDALRTNVKALVVVVLTFVFAFQVAHSAPVVFLAAPFVAFVLATLVIRGGMSISLFSAAGVCAINAVATYLGFKLLGASITGAAMGSVRL
jgi:hypothetical protein